MDFNIRRMFIVGKLWIAPGVDVSSVFNSNVVIAKNQSFGPALGQPDRILQGRLMRLTAQIDVSIALGESSRKEASGQCGRADRRWTIDDQGLNLQFDSFKVRARFPLCTKRGVSPIFERAAAWQACGIQAPASRSTAQPSD